ncbi:MAG: DUF3368 domain-containing protein [Acidithiobacillus sp.]
MGEVWVLDASPYILFARIGRLDILRGLAADIVIPDAVIGEVRAGMDIDPSAQTALEWGMPFASHDVVLPPSVISWGLGAGESQVVAQCAETGKWAVLDDRMGRRCATSHDVPVIGSLGIILRAKRFGLIDLARPWIERMISHGIYVTENVVRDVLAAVGE